MAEDGRRKELSQCREGASVKALSPLVYQHTLALFTFPINTLTLSLFQYSSIDREAMPSAQHPSRPHPV